MPYTHRLNALSSSLKGVAGKETLLRENMCIRRRHLPDHASFLTPALHPPCPSLALCCPHHGRSSPNTTRRPPHRPPPARSAASQSCFFRRPGLMRVVGAAFHEAPPRSYPATSHHDLKEAHCGVGWGTGRGAATGYNIKYPETSSRRVGYRTTATGNCKCSQKVWRRQ